MLGLKPDRVTPAYQCVCFKKNKTCLGSFVYISGKIKKHSTKEYPIYIYVVLTCFCCPRKRYLVLNYRHRLRYQYIYILTIYLFLLYIYTGS